MKLYTKTGDKGMTNLYDMTRVSKGCIFFDIVGDLDELSSNIGMLCVLVTKYNDNFKFLRGIQNKLLDIGSNIATLRKKTTGVSDDEIKDVENEIDKLEEKNPKLTAFILPGVYPRDAQAHICRSVCRRLERGMIRLHENQEDVINGVINLQEINVDKNILIYINRLSDYFFALSRNLSGGLELERGEI